MRTEIYDECYEIEWAQAELEEQCRQDCYTDEDCWEEDLEPYEEVEEDDTDESS